MDITTALLCDAAEVREGLLFILGGGVNIVQKQAFPAPAGVDLALRVELDEAELAGEHRLDISVRGPTGSVAVLNSGFAYAPKEGQPPRPANIRSSAAFVIDMGQMPLSSPGTYDVAIRLDGRVRRRVRFLAQLPESTAEEFKAQVERGDVPAPESDDAESTG